MALHQRELWYQMKIWRMILFQPFFMRLVAVAMSQEPFLLTWSQVLLTSNELENTEKCIIQSKWFLVKKMPPTTMPVVITPLAKNWLMLFLTVLENWPINVLVFKVFLFSTLLVVVLDLALLRYWWNVYRSTTARKPNLNSLFIQLLKFPRPWSNHTTQF